MSITMCCHLRPVLSVLILSLLTVSSAVAAKGPNVLLIITDEHNFRTLGCYRELMPREQGEMWGEGVVVPTPHLDRLAGEGVICTRAYATAPVCSPCRAAMITGRYPHATGVPANDLVLDRSIPTLADRLNDEGYRTGFIGKWHLGGTGKPEWSPKVDGGFQFKEFMFNRGHWKKFSMENGQPAVGATRNGKPSYDVADADETSFATDFLTDRAIEFMTDQNADEPFLTVLSYPDPHGPNTVRSPYDHRFDQLDFRPPRTYQTGVRPPKWIASGGKHPVFRGEQMSAYFGMVQCIDDNVGRILKSLDESGQLDQTLIVMTSDHGDLCYEHDRENKGNPYEGSARVPMILRQPGRIPSKSVYRQPVGTVDVTPTVMGLLQLAGDDGDQGRDLSGELLAAPSIEREPSDVESDTPSSITFLRNAGKSARWVAAIDQRYKLILSVSDDPWLFDNESDPDELLNFYSRPGTDAVTKRLGTALRQYGVDTEDPHFKNEMIAASLARVLGEEVPKLGSKQYRSRWKGSRLWIGPDWWANPMTDWMMRGGSVVGAAAKDRTLCLLTAEIGAGGERFESTLSVTRKLDGEQTPAKPKTEAGFRIGRRGGIDDYRHALVHARSWVDATIGNDGRVRIADVFSEDALMAGSDPVMLKLTGQRQGNDVELTLTASQNSNTIQVQKTLPAAHVAGGISLLCGGPSMNGGRQPVARYAFSDFVIDGDMLSVDQQRSFGPILWSQYSLNRGQLRLQAQLAPLGPRQDHRVELWVGSFEESADWEKVSETVMDKLSRTATFSVDDWDGTVAKPYQVRFVWRGERHVWEGTVRKEPGIMDGLRLGCFSCDNGYLFPIPAMVEQVKRQDPDMLFFAGDQIYEGYGGFGVERSANTPTAMIDYLRKYYQFGWTWRELLRDRPSVILPDDHDVFQGNLWGHGGRALPVANGTKPDWTNGGYLMPGDWLVAVEKTHVGHLPDPAVPMTLPNGMGTYYTSLTYGGIGFAVLEDRKFKTGPLSLPEETRSRGDGADLLGPEQEAFLAAWADDWEGQQMKCALSQTILCRAATHVGPQLKWARWFFDSGAWPIEARNRAVRILGDCNAISIHGDQHLGVLLRQGVEDFDDAGYAFMVPGTANGFPRAWWPGVKKGVPDANADYTGKYRDEAGHPIHVLAVGNPQPGSNQLPKDADPMKVGYQKGSGYGIVDFDKSDRSVIVKLYRLGNAEEMFPGFPVQLSIGGRPE